MQFLYLDQSCGTMFFIKKKRIFNICHFFRVSLKIQWRLIFAIVIGCYRLQLRVSYFSYFKIAQCVLIKEINRLLSNAFNSIKEINRLRKEVNKLLSKGMSNIYLKVNLRRSQNFDFLGLKNLSSGQFWGAPTDTDIIEF